MPRTPSTGPTFVGADDPRRLDPAFWLEPQPGEPVLHARLRQAAEIEARKAKPKRRRPTAQPPVERIGNPATFPELIPRRPYAADAFELGVYRRSRDVPLGMRNVQINSETSAGWLTFDVDRPDAWNAADEARLPEPTYCAVNPITGPWRTLADLKSLTNHKKGLFDIAVSVKRNVLSNLGQDVEVPKVPLSKV